MQKKSIIKDALIVVQGILPYYQQVLSPFLSQHPYWELVFYCAIGLYGIYMALKQDEVNEVIEFINEHPQEFREEIVQSEEFQKGFLIFFEKYLKQRLGKKKRILKAILLGFSVSLDKDKYELERLNECLERISLNSLEYLIYLKFEVLPKIESDIDKEIIKDQYQRSDRSIEWWSNQLLTSKSIWEVLERMIYEDYNPNSEKVRTMYKIPKTEGWIPDLQHRAETREKHRRSEINEAMTELVTLGIVKTRPTAITWGGGGSTDYILTLFGINFLKLLAL